MGLILASTSPRRAALMRAAGFTFEIAPAELDERVRPGEPAEAYVRRVALDKARAAAARFPDSVVLAADTCVVAGTIILGKPVDREDATRMIEMLAGRTHDVLTGVALIGPGRVRVEVETTRVRFAPMTAREIALYVASGEPADKAGAYAVQGLASRFVEAIDGSYSNVVGLPVALVYRLLCDEGWRDGRAD